MFKRILIYLSAVFVICMACFTFGLTFYKRKYYVNLEIFLVLIRKKSDTDKCDTSVSNNPFLLMNQKTNCFPLTGLPSSTLYSNHNHLAYKAITVEWQCLESYYHGLEIDI